MANAPTHKRTTDPFDGEGPPHVSVLLALVVIAGVVALSVILTLITSAGLAFYLNFSGNFGDTYGPLAGFMGAMLWAYLTAIALFLGLAFAAQLEAVRAGEAEPQSVEKVEQTEPDSEQADTEQYQCRLDVVGRLDLE